MRHGMIRDIYLLYNYIKSFKNTSLPYFLVCVYFFIFCNYSYTGSNATGDRSRH